MIESIKSDNLGQFSILDFIPDECEDSKIEVYFESSTTITELEIKHIYGIFTKKRTKDGRAVFQHDDIIHTDGRQ